MNIDAGGIRWEHRDVNTDRERFVAVPADGPSLEVWYDYSDPDNYGWAYRLVGRSGDIVDAGTLDEAGTDAIDRALCEALSIVGW